MEDPNIKVGIKHSKSKHAWNITGTKLGGKHKIAVIPYTEVSESEVLNHKRKSEALTHAEFICYCLNNSKKILSKE